MRLKMGSMEVVKVFLVPRKREDAFNERVEWFRELIKGHSVRKALAESDLEAI